MHPFPGSTTIHHRYYRLRNAVNAADSIALMSLLAAWGRMSTIWARCAWSISRGLLASEGTQGEVGFGPSVSG